MPSDIVVSIISTGFGMSVFAGILSGVCYVLIHGFQQTRFPGATSRWICKICEDDLNRNENVICWTCQTRICKQKCSKRDHKQKIWICNWCLQHSPSSTYVPNILTVSYKSRKMIHSKRKAIGKRVEGRKAVLREHKQFVRNLTKKLVSNILMESVDKRVRKAGVTFGAEDILEKYGTDLSENIHALLKSLQDSYEDSPLSEEAMSLAYAKLKFSIEKIIFEVQNPASSATFMLTTQQNEDQQTYEKLLASVIINKIHKQIVKLLTDKVPETEIGDTPQYYMDNVEQLEVSKSDKDEKNWLLQKRNFSFAVSPVSMLVPNPIVSTKVLIGDREADETSDLSDVDTEVTNVVTETHTLISAGPCLTESEDFVTRDHYVADVSSSDYEQDVEYSEQDSSLPSVLKKSPTLQYGRDYYTRQASIPSGTKLEEVSYPNDITQLEASFMYSSLPRRLYTSRNATRNFAKNPLLNFKF